MRPAGANERSLASKNWFYTEDGEEPIMQRKLLEILACPIDKHHPLELLDFSVNNQTIIEGVLLCSQCGRYYPIIDEIPVMLPDNLRSRKEDLEFLEKWKAKLPESVVQSGKPWNLNGP